MRPGYIHIFVDWPLVVAPCDIVRTLKSISAIEMFKAYPQLKQFYSRCGVLWSRGHFVSTVGHICEATVKKYSIDAVFALTKAEDIWRGMEKCLYGNGKTTHFSKYGKLPCIRAKQINRGIPMFVEDGKLRFKLRKMQFGIQVNDNFQSDEVNAVLSYLENSDKMDADAVNTLIKAACGIDTYRPCYATLVPRLIRGKYRVYLHLTIEGKAKPKYDRFGNPRHKYGKGMIGADIGTQTVAYTSDTKVGVKNLSERNNSIQTSERKERLYYRAMDRSRRATNPQNYNPDGTIKKGKKTWKYSNRYKKQKAKHA